MEAETVKSLDVNSSPTKSTDSDERTSGYGSDVPEGKDPSSGEGSKTERSIDSDSLICQPNAAVTYAQPDVISSSVPDAGGKNDLWWVEGTEGTMAAEFGAALSSLTSKLLLIESSKEALRTCLVEAVKYMDERILFVEDEARNLPDRLDAMGQYCLRYEQHLHKATTLYLYHLGFYSARGLLYFAEHCFTRLMGYHDGGVLTFRQKWKLAFDCCQTLRDLFSEEGVPFDEEQVLSLAESLINDLDGEEQWGGKYGDPLTFGEPDQDKDALPKDAAIFVRRLAQFLNVCVQVNNECCDVHELIRGDSYRRSAVWNADDKGTGDSEFLSVIRERTVLTFSPSSLDFLEDFTRRCLEDALGLNDGELQPQVESVFIRFSDKFKELYALEGIAKKCIEEERIRLDRIFQVLAPMNATNLYLSGALTPKGVVEFTIKLAKTWSSEGQLALLDFSWRDKSEMHRWDFCLKYCLRFKNIVQDESRFSAADISRLTNSLKDKKFSPQSFHMESPVFTVLSEDFTKKELLFITALCRFAVLKLVVK